MSTQQSNVFARLTGPPRAAILTDGRSGSSRSTLRVDLLQDDRSAPASGSSLEAGERRGSPDEDGEGGVAKPPRVDARVAHLLPRALEQPVGVLELGAA